MFISSDFTSSGLQNLYNLYSEKMCALYGGRWFLTKPWMESFPKFKSPLLHAMKIHGILSYSPFHPPKASKNEQESINGTPWKDKIS